MTLTMENGTASALRGLWESRYPGIAPIGHLLRAALPERWLRIHTVPESKRYPESPDEMREVLRRHNAVLSHLLRSAPELVLVTAGYTDGPEPGGAYPQVEALGLLGEHFLSVPMDEPGDAPPEHWHFFARSMRWAPGALDALLELVAEDVVANVLVVEPRTGAVYHPYDGGADIFLPTTSERDALRERYREWVSNRPDGL
jgi:hypothetical protein